MAEELGVISVSSFCFSASGSFLSLSVSSDQLISTEVSAGNRCLFDANVVQDQNPTTYLIRKVLFMGKKVIH